MEESQLCQHISGAPRLVKVNIMRIWNDRKLDVSAKNKALILYLENEMVPVPPIQPPKADPVQQATEEQHHRSTKPGRVRAMVAAIDQRKAPPSNEPRKPGKPSQWRLPGTEAKQKKGDDVGSKTLFPRPFWR
ncbi:hypothetical protein FIBSPDRAFT_859833 [Athelia psychrophila]|uniref:Uncharacterized protein n=1 Tax=Athelia psychrophila TaxID=1759441 RepID=A0A166KU47_9AGAM|nr:hypothetical protein FIBSPDRAFT_859833 [Fibularhizoctonia sp. CBS 109695]